LRSTWLRFVVALGAFENASASEKCDVSENSLGPAGGQALAAALKTNKTLYKVVLSGQGKGSSVTIHADQLLQPWWTHWTIYSGQGLHVDGATFIVAELLKSNTSITTVRVVYLDDITTARLADYSRLSFRCS
jgi:hypothetical protein